MELQKRQMRLGLLIIVLLWLAVAGMLAERAYAGTVTDAEGNRYVVESALGTVKLEKGVDVANVTIPDKVTVQGEEYPVTAIMKEAFQNYVNLTDVEIPKTIETISDNAFNGCSNLTTVSIAEESKLGRMGLGVFRGCINLETVNMPKNMTNDGIGTEAFLGCSSLKSISIPQGVTAINIKTFYGCSSLETVDLPSTLEGIHANAFQGCRALKNIQLPKKVSTLASEAFSGCEAIEKITIPSGLGSVAANAFSGCKALSEVVLENAATIDEKAFFGCEKLKSITIQGLPGADSGIYSKAFSGVPLTSITIPNNSNLFKIKDDAFENNKITSVLILTGDSSESISATVNAVKPAIGAEAEKVTFYKGVRLTPGTADLKAVKGETLNLRDTLVQVYDDQGNPATLPKDFVSSFGQWTLNGTGYNKDTKIESDMLHVSAKESTSPMTIDRWYQITAPDPAIPNSSGTWGSGKVTVTVLTTSSIEIQAAPAKTTYTVGESFDPTGMKLKVNYEGNNSSDIITEGFSVNPQGPLSANDTSVSISYGTTTIQYPITVRPVVPPTPPVWLSGVVIKEAPIKTTYTEGEYFDPSGMKVEAVYSNNTTADVSGACTISPDRALTIDDKEVMVYYTPFSTSQPITVIPKEIEYPDSISLSQNTAEMYPGQQLTLRATMLPEEAKNQTVTWKTSDSQVAKVDTQGAITAVSKGSATITAETANGKTADCQVTVKLDTPSLKADFTGITTIKLTAEAIKGATGYQFYYATSENGKYQKLVTDDSRTYTHKKLTTGKTYYYKVRAYSKVEGVTDHSGFSKVTSEVPRPSTPVFTLTAGKKKVTIKWAEVKGADGYVIYRTSEPKRRVAVPEDSRKFTDSSKLKSGKTYTYKMKAYTRVKGKNVYSDGGKNISVKVK